MIDIKCQNITSDKILGQWHKNGGFYKLIEEEQPESNCSHDDEKMSNHITNGDETGSMISKYDFQFPGVRYAVTFLKRGGLALVLETPEEINTILKQTK